MVRRARDGQWVTRRYSRAPECAERGRTPSEAWRRVSRGPCDAWAPAGGAGAGRGGRSGVRACTRRVGAPMGEKALLAGGAANTMNQF